MNELQGAGLCGAVQYTIPDALQYAGYCHCSECRRFSGSIFSAFGAIPKSSFRLLKGVDAIKQFRKSKESTLAFCGSCGSSLYAEKPKREMLHLRLGALLDAPSLTPQRHAFVASKAPRYDINDGLPQFAAGSNPTAQPLPHGK